MELRFPNLMSQVTAHCLKYTLGKKEMQNRIMSVSKDIVVRLAEQFLDKSHEIYLDNRYSYPTIFLSCYLRGSHNENEQKTHAKNGWDRTEARGSNPEITAQ